MTLEEAAAVLHVRPDAEAGEVERAYRKRARMLHPDRLAGASEPEIHAAAERFARLAEAHELLVHEIAERPVVATIEPESPPPSARWVIIGWLAVLLIAGIVSYLGGPLPYSTGDVVLRLLPLAASATAYALTGKRVFYAMAIALLAASALVTLALVSFGALVSFALLLVPVIGLVLTGRRVRI